MNFRDPAVLDAHIRHTLDFYRPRCTDPSGGFFHFYRDDGSVYDAHTRHLVSSTRFVFNFAMAWRRYGRADDRAALLHGLRFLREAHLNTATGGYRWQLDWRDGQGRTLDGTNHCYGLAFVVLAYAHALMAGVEEARAWLAETWALMEQRFWEPAAGLYADEASEDWSRLDAYRGQNANMHACEALLAAFDATGELRYLHRAETLARNICQRQAGLAEGLVWEHYKADWSVDWDYNREDKSNIFRPWGYQPGHLTEWAKLLLILERHRAQLQGDAGWLLDTARCFFDVAVETAWDDAHGGLVYGFAPDQFVCPPPEGTRAAPQGGEAGLGSGPAAGFKVCDGDKYFWVQAESLATAALLALRTGEDKYWSWYERLWDYSWRHFVDHEHGAWYRILGPANEKLSDEKSPAGKTDYHTMGACYEVLLGLKLAGQA